MKDDKQNFIQAIEEDEYAEYRLATEDVLVTDWEGDGTFNPHVVPSYERVDRAEVIAEQIEYEFDMIVREINWDENQSIYHVRVNRDNDR